MDDLEYWLALNSLTDIGPVTARRLLSACGGPGNIFRMSFDELRRIEGVGEHRARSITGFKGWDAVRREADSIAERRITVLTINDERYPRPLRAMQSAPVVLYMKGDLRDVDKYAVSIVGSRRATAYGMEVAEKISYRLASKGLTVVSGMARGIDTASHKGALKAGGRTVAVMGSGLDVPYPASNRGLMNAIAGSGAVISEFPLGTLPNKENFPRRNRIISALSLGVIVVEATLDSGSLITVAYALEQGREVFAVPGNVTSRNSRGTNDLIKKGARLVESAEDVIRELGPQIKGILREDRQNEKEALSAMTEDEKMLYSYLSTGPKHIDSIIRETDTSTAKALSILLGLELKGIVRQTEGKHFSLN
ncbi:MAG: DNA-protecting protein DprA [Deferribacteres bacterium]|nr:DNA-protecting protein DprA [Deferribacteres bacterium]